MRQYPVVIVRGDHREGKATEPSVIAMNDIVNPLAMDAANFDTAYKGRFGLRPHYQAVANYPAPESQEYKAGERESLLRTAAAGNKSIAYDGARTSWTPRRDGV